MSGPRLPLTKPTIEGYPCPHIRHDCGPPYMCPSSSWVLDSCPVFVISVCSVDVLTCRLDSLMPRKMYRNQMQSVVTSSPPFRNRFTVQISRPKILSGELVLHVNTSVEYVLAPHRLLTPRPLAMTYIEGNRFVCAATLTHPSSSTARVAANPVSKSACMSECC